MQLLGWAAVPGDCVVFHGKTLHGAAGNSSTCTQRRVLSTRCLLAELARSIYNSLGLTRGDRQVAGRGHGAGEAALGSVPA